MNAPRREGPASQPGQDHGLQRQRRERGRGRPRQPTLHGLGYKIAGTANAHRQDYATSVVMYRPGFRADGMRLAKAIGVKVVGPLDGIVAGALHGGEIAVIVGA